MALRSTLHKLTGVTASQALVSPLHKLTGVTASNRMNERDE
jgi:hypothetical protein